MATQISPQQAEESKNAVAVKPSNDLPKASMPEEKKEDDNRPAPPTAVAQPPQPPSVSPKKTPADSVLPVNMPNSMMSPNNRPPSRSSMSVASAGSGGGRTTTSRRGGRTRSRSPTGNIHSYAGRPPSTTPSVPSEVGNVSPRNPSAAAAAAAAAAKSFRNPGATRGGAYSYPGYGSSSAGPSRGDPYGRQPGRPQDPYASSRYPPGSGPRQPPPTQRPPSSASTSYPGQPPRPHSRSSASYPGGPPPPGYYDPHNPSRNPPSSSHHPAYHQRSRNGPPPVPGSGRYDSQPPPPTGPDGRPLSRNGGDSQNPYGYNPYHRSSGAAPPSSRGGMPPGSARDYPPSNQYPPGSSSASASGRYGPGNSSSQSSGPVDSGEYGRQHHGASRHTPPPHHRHQYPGGGPPPSSSRTSRQPYPGSSSSSSHPSYRHGDPNARGPPQHYRGGPPPSSSQARGGPPPGHPDYHRYHAQQQAQQHKKESMVKSTRTVMGTATPLHLNKGGPLPPNAGPQAKPSSYKSNPPRREPAPSRRGTAASVFRGRPGSVQGGGAPPNSNNPKSILDSLESPSNSFEEKKSSRGDKDSDQLSPEEPPKLRGSGNNAASNGTTELVFDPQRSPKSQATGAAGLTMSPPQLTNSLDMAPSFSLFNQSFDSLGDGPFFNASGALDSAMLNVSTSFELKTSGSRSPSSDNPLQLSSSNGTFKLNASMSGGPMFSMSPTNSFGNGPTASFPTGAVGGSVTVLGGNSENGRSSPSQVLDLYKSAGSIEEADLRLSASLGSPMIGASHSYSSSRPFATGMEGGPKQPALSGGDYKLTSNRRSHLSPRPQRRFSGQGGPFRPQRATSAGPPNKDGTPRFYNFLRNNRDAFLDCTFLLPELKAAIEKSRKNAKEGTVSNESTPKRGQSSRNRYDRMPTAEESAIARRRIVSAICAFGGTFVGNRGKIVAPPSSESSPDESKSSSNKPGVSKANSQSIFREKSGEPATVTPNSSGASTGVPSSAQAKYDGALPTRYYESDNRLSWEFEENPPIETTSKGPEDFQWCQAVGDESPIKKLKKEGADDQSDDEETMEDDGDETKESKDDDEKGESPKMRYRCKLCGQPKTDHVCPYQQSLVRNIGVMVKPAVNAFTAAEPGQLAPDLKEMNNMAISAASLAAENADSADTVSSSRPTPDRSSVRGARNNIDGDEAAAQVTPESLRSGNGGPILSPDGRSRIGTPSTGSSRRRAGTPSSSTTPSKKRSHSRMTSIGGQAGDQTDLLFVEEMELKSEQFRTVTPSKAISENKDAYTYPALPLPYAQRKRLSDNLFSLSKEIPQLTDECAAVLREARERDLWDLAVAELMTQVVVVVHCHDGDNTFEGLRRYLLTLGFTC